MNSSLHYSFNKLREYVADDPQQIKEMIQLFIDTIPPDVDKLLSFSIAGDFENSYKMAHRIKPSFDVFDISDIFNELSQVESISRETKDQKYLLEKVVNIHDKVTDIVEKMKNEPEYTANE